MRIFVAMAMAAGACNNSKPATAKDKPEPGKSAPEPAPAPAEPTFSSETQRRDAAQDAPDLYDGVARDVRIEREQSAMRALYERCSSTNAAWREGPEIEGTYVYPSKKEPGARVNVSVKLPRRDEVARGNVLFYRVDFHDGKPKRFLANKKISAELCGLDREEMLVDL